MKLRMRPTPTPFPIGILYNPVDNKPLLLFSLLFCISPRASLLKITAWLHLVDDRDLLTALNSSEVIILGSVGRCLNSSPRWSVGFSIQNGAMDAVRSALQGCGCYLLAPLTGNTEGRMRFMTLRVRATPTQFPANIHCTLLDSTARVAGIVSPSYHISSFPFKYMAPNLVSNIVWKKTPLNHLCCYLLWIFRAHKNCTLEV